MIENSSRIVVALDYNNEQDALNLVNKIKPEQCRLKIGKEMFTYFGPSLVGKLVDKGFDVFLDLKFHDIPATTAKACVAAANLGVWMVNVHTSGGEVMMRTAQEALQKVNGRKPLLIGVTVLTSMDQSDLNGLGILKTPQEQVLALATLANQSGLDGVVCSAQEAKMLKTEIGEHFKLVTPGIRPVGADVGDQKRIMTPEMAVKDGADYLVIGRPITQAADPYSVLEQINESLKNN